MLSVVLPVYNKADTLKASVDSVLAQDYDDFELLIVDDGSTDGIEAVLDAYRAEARVRVFHQANGGVSQARNRGIDEARGEIVCFLDADDEWLPEHLSTINRLAAAHPEAVLLMSACRTLSPNGNESDNARFLPPEAEGRLIEDYFAYTESIGGEMVLLTIAIGVRARVLKEESRFQRGVRIGEDYDLWLRILARYPAAFCARVTAVYHREHSTATAGSNMDVDWYFQSREAGLLADESIPPARRRNIRAFMDRFRIRKARHLLMAGRKAEAWRTLLSVSVSAGNRRAYAMTVLCLLLPSALVGTIYKRKKEGE